MQPRNGSDLMARAEAAFDEMESPNPAEMTAQQRQNINMAARAIGAQIDKNPNVVSEKIITSIFEQAAKAGIDLSLNEKRQVLILLESKSGKSFDWNKILGSPQNSADSMFSALSLAGQLGENLAQNRSLLRQIAIKELREAARAGQAGEVVQFEFGSGKGLQQKIQINPQKDGGATVSFSGKKYTFSRQELI